MTGCTSGGWCRRWGISLSRSSTSYSRLARRLRCFRIGRSLGCQLAHEYLNSGGTSRLPVVRLGEKCSLIPRWALTELATTGRVVRLRDAETPVDGASDAR